MANLAGADEFAGAGDRIVARNPVRFVDKQYTADGGARCGARCCAHPPDRTRQLVREAQNRIERMRIGIIGAGAIGASLGALLVRGGHEVGFAARGEHLAAIRERGLRLSGAFGEFTVRVEAAETLAPGAELIVVATKAHDARAAIREHRAAIDGQRLLIVQNGLDGIVVGTEEAPECEIVGGLAVYAASYLNAGHIAVTTGGTLYVGGTGGAGGTDGAGSTGGTGGAVDAVRADIAVAAEVPARELAALFGAVLPTVYSSNFVGAQWTKLMLNQINALPAITGLSVQETVANDRLRLILTASMREAVGVAAARGIRFATLQGLSDTLLRVFASMPLWIGQAMPRLMSARIGSVPNPGSTLQSIRRGRLTEIDYLNGALVRAAEAIGVAAPVNAALVTLVHEVERTTVFLSAGEVAERITV